MCHATLFLLATPNTTIVRSNYLWDESAHLYEKALKLWEGLSQDLNYNVMFSQRAHVTLLHSPAARDGAARRYNTMRLTGSDGELLGIVSTQDVSEAIVESSVSVSLDHDDYL